MLEMTAGRELDALILERVIGFRWDENQCRVCGWPLDRARGGVGCRPDDCSMRPKPINRADEPPHYSTSIADAWLVVEKMRERGWSFRFGNNSCCSDQHAAAFARGFRGLGANILTGAYIESDNAVGLAETAPLAICRAALKAVNQEAAV